MSTTKREGEAPAEPREGEAPAEPREGEAPAEPNQGFEPNREDEALADPLRNRRHPVHGIKYVDGQPTIIFDTLCVKNRAPILACDEFHDAFREVAESSTAWLMGRYVIMPDHMHFFAGDVGSDISYENWVKYLKSQITKRYLGGQGSRRAAGGRGSRRADADQDIGQAPRERRPPMPFRWLTDHWDTRVRNAEVYEEKWQYCLNNPVRKGLVSHPSDWPFQGEIFELRW
jgi:putative transposase